MTSSTGGHRPAAARPSHQEPELTYSEEQRRAAEALRLVDADPIRARQLARSVLAGVDGSHDHAAAAVAGRAAGLCELHLSHTDAAVRLLTDAARAARRGGDAQLEGEATMSLAYAWARRGAPRRALRLIDRALRDLSGLSQLRARAQRGGILQQLGRLDEALSDYAAALPVLRAAGDWAWVQRVLSNRAVLSIYRSRLAEADADLAEAAAVCRAAGLDLQLALVHDNTGFLHLRRGDVPAALEAYGEAERLHREAGAPAGTVLLDRSELLLSVHLVREAREVAQQAVEEFTQLRRFILLPQAQLLVAEAALLDQDLVAAQRAAEQARRRFRRQERQEWVALARHTVLKCRLARGGRSRPTVAELALTADHLHAFGFPAAAAEARIAAATLALDRGHVGEARELLRQTSAARTGGPAAVRVHAWHGAALLRMAEDRPRAAGAALRRGISILTEYQATIGATELRAHTAWHREALVASGLRLALGTGRPEAVLAWSERGRAVAALTRPVRPPEDPVLAQALVELRATVRALGDAAATGAPRQALLRRQLELEAAVRERARLTRGPGALRLDRPGLAELSAALGEAALVEFVEVDGRLHAVTVAGGRARMHPLASTVAAEGTLPHIPLALRRLLRTEREDRGTAAAELLSVLGRRLDRQLLEPLTADIDGRPLVLVPTGALQCIPWALLPSCRGRPVTVAPSATLWYRAATAALPGDGVLAVAGPGLANAEVEAGAVADLYRSRGLPTDLLTGEHASVDRVRAGLARAGIAHLAAHGSFRTDNPLFSHLRLADAPLTIYDLEPLPSVPSLVVLAACDSAQAQVCTGDELLGLSVTFLEKGTSALIGTVVPVPDAETAPLMIDLHRRLLGGASAAEALAGAQERAAATPAGLAAAAGLVCFGAGGSVHAAQPTAQNREAGLLPRLSTLRPRASTSADG